MASRIKQLNTLDVDNFLQTVCEQPLQQDYMSPTTYAATAATAPFPTTCSPLAHHLEDSHLLFEISILLTQFSTLKAPSTKSARAVSKHATRKVGLKPVQ